METPVSNGDAYPPGNVKDLSAMLVDETGMDVSVHLRWTAPGDELDSGTGTHMAFSLERPTFFIKIKLKPYSIETHLFSEILRNIVLE